MRLSLRLAVVGVLATLLASPVLAGPYSDDLAKCLVESTSAQDKVDFARWIFIAIAAHPSVKEWSKATAADREAILTKVGHLFTRLLTQDCRDKADKALRYEQSSAVQGSFSVLGQVAMQELMTNKDVKAVLEDLGKHTDSSEIEKLGKPAPEPDSQQH